MKKTLLIMLLIFALPGVVFAGEDGAAIFKSQGCTSCHRPDKSTKLNPSLADIAEAYQDKEGQLAGYLNGEAEPIVKPEKAAMMKRYIERTKNLSDAERKALADYIMGYKK